MTTPLKWTRSVSAKTGLSVFTSACGRFVIRQHRGGWATVRVYYLLDVDGKPAPRHLREADTLTGAKDAANLIANPNYEPV